MGGVGGGGVSGEGGKGKGRWWWWWWVLHLEVLEPRARRLLEHQALARRLCVVHPLVLLGAPLLLGSLRPLAHLLLPLALLLQPGHLLGCAQLARLLGPRLLGARVGRGCEGRWR